MEYKTYVSIVRPRENWRECYYCREMSTVYCSTDNIPLCDYHYVMHFNDDPMMDLVHLAKLADAQS